VSNLQSTTGFPNQIDVIPDPSSSTSPLGDINHQAHHLQHTIENDAIVAIESRVGIVGSTDSASHEYWVAKVRELFQTGVLPPASPYLPWTATKTSAYSAEACQAVPCDTSSATFAVTLPDNTTANGAPIRIKWKAGANPPTIAAAGSTSIDPSWTGFANVNDSVDFTYNANTTVWEVV
jgi:hypothetical protein